MTEYRNTPRTRQEAFDLAAAHLLKTRKPSLAEPNASGFASCLYGGSGCALAPFLPVDPALVEEWDALGAIGDIPEDKLPDHIVEDLEFYNELQEAHDEPAAGKMAVPPGEWLSEWLRHMRAVARKYRLSPAVLEKETSS